jgi:hypothetical protein
MAEFWLHPGSSAEISLRLITGNLGTMNRDLRAEQGHDSRTPRRFLESFGNRRRQEGKGLVVPFAAPLRLRHSR